jgi:acyl carrier protein
MAMDSVMRDDIIQFIRDEYLEDPNQEVTELSPLISSGIVDSFSMVSLKLYLEDKYNIKMTDEEASTEAFDTIASIMTLVQRKLASV